MTHSDQWHQVDRLFQRYLECEDQEREAFLKQVKAQDPVLFEELLSLINDSQQVDLFFEPSLSSLPDPSSGSEEFGDLEPGAILSKYRIENVINRGGMGTVYMARREDQSVEQVVAVKLLNLKLSHPTFVAQFRRENQILASLQHPNIPMYIDSGMTEDGQPFMVMEYVPGLPIDRYCEQQKLDQNARLDLILQMCDALSYSHRKLIVHRDLKPQNILVSDEGLVKIVDFGIARFLDQTTGIQKNMTQTQVRSMTPGYASPEHLKGLPVSVSSDVYSLGVVIYELLTKRPAFPDIEQVYDYQAQIIENRHPVAMSQLKSVVWSRQLAGDLDAIVAKSIRFDPVERYPSIESLRSDLNRFLAGRPVLARRHSFFYVWKRVLQRHKLMISSICFALICLGALAFQSWQHTRSLEREHRRSEQVTEFLIDIFRAADPTVQLGAQRTVEDVLQAGTRKLSSAMESEPDFEIRFHDVFGQIYFNLGSYLESETHFLKALELANGFESNSPETIAGIQNFLGLNYLNQSRFQEAADLLVKSEDVLVKRLGPNHVDCLIAKNRLGLLEHSRGNFTAAESIYRQVMDKANRQGISLNTLSSNFVATLISLRKWDEAERILSELLERARHNGDVYEEMILKGKLASLLASKGAFENAESLAREHLEDHKRIYGEDHVKIASAQLTLGTVLLKMGKYAESEYILLKSLDLAKTHLKTEQHSLVATIWNALGNLHSLQGNFEASLAANAEALAIYKAIYPSVHPSVAICLHDKANILQKMGRYPEAETIHKEALSMSEKILGPTYANFLVSPTSLGYLYFFSGRNQEARPLFERSVSSFEAHFGPDHPKTLEAQHGLAWIEFELGDKEKGLRRFQKVASSRRRVLGARHPDYATTLHSLAWVQYTLGQMSKAKDSIQEALSIRKEVLGEDHPDLAWSTNNYGLILQAEGDLAAALDAFNKAFVLREKALGAWHPHAVQSLNNGILCLEQMGKWKEAIQGYRDILKRAARIWGDSSPQVARLSHRYGMALFEAGADNQAEQVLIEAFHLYRDELSKQEVPDPLQVDLALVRLKGGKANLIHEQHPKDGFDTEEAQGFLVRLCRKAESYQLCHEFNAFLDSCQGIDPDADFPCCK